MTRQVPFALASALPWRAAVAASLLLTAACSEPVDCSLEPHRCPTPGSSVLPPKPAEHRASAPSEGLDPTVRNRRIDRAAYEMAARRGQRLIDVPAGDPVRQVLRAARLQGGTPTAGKDAATVEGGVSAMEVRAVLGALRGPMKARDLDGLVGKLTPRLATTLREALPQNGERLWRHMDRYLALLEAGFDVSEGPGDSAGVRQVVLTPSAGGRELKPIFAKTADGWKVERF